MNKLSSLKLEKNRNYCYNTTYYAKNRAKK